MSWPDLPGSPYAGECWALEAELTPKPLARTAAIMSALVTRTADYHPDATPGPGRRYDRVIYLAAPAAGRPGSYRPRRRLVTAAVTGAGDGTGPAAGGACMSIFWAYIKFRIAVAVLRRPAVTAGPVCGGAGGCRPITLVAGVGFAGAVVAGEPRYAPRPAHGPCSSPAPLLSHPRGYSPSSRPLRCWPPSCPARPAPAPCPATSRSATPTPRARSSRTRPGTRPGACVPPMTTRRWWPPHPVPPRSAM